MRHPADISEADLARVCGGGILKPSTIARLEAGAKAYAQKALGGGGHDLYAGTDITNSVAQKGIILHGPNRGVLVSTGDDPTGHAPQFYVGRVLMKKLGQFVGMKDL